MHPDIPASRVRTAVRIVCTYVAYTPRKSGREEAELSLGPINWRVRVVEFSLLGQDVVQVVAGYCPLRTEKYLYTVECVCFTMRWAVWKNNIFQWCCGSISKAKCDIYGTKVVVLRKTLGFSVHYRKFLLSSELSQVVHTTIVSKCADSVTAKI